jgi:hypothetical protein
MDMLIPQPRFPGVLAPTSDMQRVRDGRQAGPFYLDIDLGTARSVAAGTALELNISGNFLYMDQRQGSGLATLYLEQDDRGMTPFTVFAGWKAKVAFTRLFVENASQPGAILRLVYGVDLDLDPGIGAGVSVLNPVTIEDSIGANYNHYSLSTAVAVGNNASMVIDGATAPRGIRIRHIYLSGAAGAGGTITLAVFATDNFWAAGFATSNRAIAIATLANSTTAIQQISVPLRLRVPFGLGGPGGTLNRLFVFYAASVAVGGCDAGIDYEII